MSIRNGRQEKAGLGRGGPLNADALRTSAHTGGGKSDHSKGLVGSEVAMLATQAGRTWAKHRYEGQVDWRTAVLYGNVESCHQNHRFNFVLPYCTWAHQSICSLIGTEISRLQTCGVHAAGLKTVASGAKTATKRLQQVCAPGLQSCASGWTTRDEDR